MIAVMVDFELDNLFALLVFCYMQINKSKGNISIGGSIDEVPQIGICIYRELC